MGTEDNPIVWAFVPSADSETVLAGANEITDIVQQETGLVIEARVATDYSAVIEAMCNGEAQMGALNTFGYVLAHGRGCADVAMVSVRFGANYYTGQIIAGNDTGITSIADLAGKTFCRPDPLSTSGWIIPSITMRANGINPDKRPGSRSWTPGGMTQWLRRSPTGTAMRARPLSMRALTISAKSRL